MKKWIGRLSLVAATTVCLWDGLGKLMAPMRRRSTSSSVDLVVGPSTVPAKGSHGRGICARR
ncbi:hypothetical protein E2562_020206 [Oryza meyeriana var. granulata]|uniref:Uncharacterized protein n=1 Tax=Oryza meyeriana var. granulata TaxID=110450 RepID=A0A6G1BM51_9ORYZ|nr:hypothetical protein E2562_020206 [Oryza meyeriana var. granulata]